MFLAWVVAPGCGWETHGEADGDGDADADTDADSDGDGDSVEVRVLTQDRSGARAAAGGATVAFDMPNGERVERTADADGRVTFERVNWSSGAPASVIAHLPGWQVGGIVAMTEGFVEARQELTVLLGANPRSLENLVEVHGTATMIDPAHYLAVIPDIPGRPSQEWGPAWSVMVRAGEPFSLVALEFPQQAGATADHFEQPIAAWATVQHEAVTERTTIELDMTRGVESLRFGGSVEKPQDTIPWSHYFQDSVLYVVSGSLRGLGLFASSASDAQIGGWWDSEISGDGWGYTGMGTLFDGAASPVWTYEGEQLTNVVADPATVYSWCHIAPLWDVLQSWQIENEQASGVVVPGMPGEGLQVLAYPEPPNVPNGDDDAYRLGDVLQWQLGATDAADPDLEVLIVLFGANRLDAVANLFAPPGTTSARVPIPPSDVAGLVDSEGQGQVRLCELDSDRQLCLRFARSELFSVVE